MVLHFAAALRANCHENTACEMISVPTIWRSSADPIGQFAWIGLKPRWIWIRCAQFEAPSGESFRKLIDVASAVLILLPLAMYSPRGTMTSQQLRTAPLASR